MSTSGVVSVTTVCGENLTVGAETEVTSVMPTVPATLGGGMNLMNWPPGSRSVMVATRLVSPPKKILDAASNEVPAAAVMVTVSPRFAVSELRVAAICAWGTTWTATSTLLPPRDTVKLVACMRSTSR